jgi:hypothetical protein
MALPEELYGFFCIPKVRVSRNQCVLTNRLASSAVNWPVISAPMPRWKRRMASRVASKANWEATISNDVLLSLLELKDKNNQIALI